MTAFFIKKGNNSIIKIIAHWDFLATYRPCITFIINHILKLVSIICKKNVLLHY